MSLPKIKVGDTVRVTDTEVFADFVQKGDIATIADIEFGDVYVDIWMESDKWGWTQFVRISTDDFRGWGNLSVTFLHDSQKLVDKPSE
ncbi:hypothetical protein [Acinetobacter phage P577]|uniref:hypothetical protein n=1 Tax=Acinetobacter phage YMC13/03/R2096 TaxID=1560342 RepID=UPI00052AC66D|nr:hypothetical protein ACQ36_gp096 [Acinetobacter phage YMC13/03/R2096]AIW02837.1 hypothetical protein BPABA577_01030 [Acinetobacter phage YMC13/03/R2096]WNT46161.1 hypothetical protein [Acinetobacter phage P577]